MVAGIIRARLDAEGVGDEVSVRSAGTYAEPGEQAYAPVRVVMKERGIDLSRHRSQPVSTEMVQAADLIIVMEEAHRQSIFYLSPRALRKVFLLSELAGDSAPLIDAVGRPDREVRRMIDQATLWVEDGWGPLRQRIG